MTRFRFARPPLPLLVALLLVRHAAPAQERLLIVLRVDDVMSRNTAIQPRSILPFEQAAAARGAKVTWVVIPHRLIEATNADGALTRELRASAGRGHEISQHGYNHICTRCSQTGHEMWCAAFSTPFTYTDQRRFLLDGERILADSLTVVPRSFVSPGHYEDTVTYRLLRDEGYDVISTPRVPTKSFAHPGVFNLAHHREYTWAMTAAGYAAQRDSALRHVAVEGERDGYFCFLFHDYFIRSGYENGIVIRWLGEVLDSLSSRYGSRLEFLTLSSAADRFRSPAGVADAGTVLPDRIELLQNYPNPFNPSTVLRYSLPLETRVTLKVFDLLGREVATLVDGPVPAGTHEVVFDARDMASGTYLCRLDAGDATASPAAVRSVVRTVLLLR
jgi:predicted deacetylase